MVSTGESNPATVVQLKPGKGFERSIEEKLKNRYDITDGIYATIDNKIVVPAASENAVRLFKNHPSVESLVKRSDEKGKRVEDIFPHDARYPWNKDFFGPLYIPEAGKTIDITIDNLPLYKRVITEYEGNELEVKGNQIFINGELADTYTFKQDYYWMMGDNRHNSQDSRYCEWTAATLAKTIVSRSSGISPAIVAR